LRGQIVTSGSNLNIAAIVAGSIIGFLVLCVIIGGLAYCLLARGGSGHEYQRLHGGDYDDYELH
jgi:hypothetical protein